MVPISRPTLYSSRQLREARMIYRFDEFELDKSKFELRHRGEARHVEPLVFDLIGFFCANAGRVVTRDEIIDDVWNGRIVSDATVAGCVKSARKALTVEKGGTSYIRTIRGRGFSFEAQVEAVPIASGDPPQPAAVAEPKHDGAVTQPFMDPGDVPLGGQPSIAVLPLHSLTPDERFGPVGDAISQEVILELSRLHWLFVIARGSSFKFRGSGVDIAEAGRILGARYVLTGTIALIG